MEMRMKRKLLFLAVVLLAYPAAAQERRFIVPIEDSPAQGPAGAPVTIVEFIDFQ
jgi:hypothetical protein